MISGKEAGFLLLTCRFGDPNRKVLSASQLRILGERMRTMPKPSQERDLEEGDLLAIGYSREGAGRILSLLEDQELLSHYIRRGERLGCMPISRVSERYPAILKDRLGQETPGCLWAKGDLAVLDGPMIALVGSRDIRPENKAFAAEVGRQAALQGYTLVSGNARGADRTAQAACLKAGGKVISIVADALAQKTLLNNVLYLSEDDFDEAFSAQRALSRNRIIHCLGEKTFVAQADLEKGGSWDGTVKNLRHGWSPVFCFDDGSDAMAQLSQMGGNLTYLEELADIKALQNRYSSFLE